VTFNPRSAAIGLTVAGTAAWGLSWLSELPFWAAFLIMVLALLFTGFVAEVEDRNGLG
jgi:hypothetical protein